MRTAKTPPAERAHSWYKHPHAAVKSTHAVNGDGDVLASGIVSWSVATIREKRIFPTKSGIVHLSSQPWHAAVKSAYIVDVDVDVDELACRNVT